MCVACSNIRPRTLFVSVDETIVLQTDDMPSQTSLAMTLCSYKEIAPKDLIPSLHYFGVAVDNKVWVGMKQGNCSFISSPFFNSIARLMICVYVHTIFVLINIRITFNVYFIIILILTYSSYPLSIPSDHTSRCLPYFSHIYDYY